MIKKWHFLVLILMIATTFGQELSLKISFEKRTYLLGENQVCLVELVNRSLETQNIWGFYDASNFNIIIKNQKGEKLNKTGPIEFSNTVGKFYKLEPSKSLSNTIPIGNDFGNNGSMISPSDIDRFFTPGKYSIQIQFDFKNYIKGLESPLEKKILSNIAYFTVVEPSKTIDKEAFEYLQQVTRDNENHYKNHKLIDLKLLKEFTKKYKESYYGPLGYLRFLYGAAILGDYKYDDCLFELCQKYPDNFYTLCSITAYAAGRKDIKANKYMITSINSLCKKYPHSKESLNSIKNVIIKGK